MEHANIGTAQHAVSADTQKVLRNTYMLLGMTLAFSAVTAGISMSMNLGHGIAMISLWLHLLLFGLCFRVQPIPQWDFQLYFYSLVF